MQVLVRIRDMAQSRRRERAPASGGGGGDPQPPEAQRPISTEPSRATARIRIAAPASVPSLEVDGVVPSVVQPGRETKGQKKNRRQKERKERRRKVGTHTALLRTGQEGVGPSHRPPADTKSTNVDRWWNVLTQEQQEQEQQGPGGGEEGADRGPRRSRSVQSNGWARQ
jgi:hypothetical protein